MPHSLTGEFAATEADPLGPLVDPLPRPLPPRVAHTGRACTLEPLAIAHAEDLWEAAQLPGADASWAWMGYGPFASLAAMRAQVASMASVHDPLAFAIRPARSGTVDGWLTLMDIQPKNAAIELGSIWFSPRLQRSRAATEAMYLLMRHAFDDLGYRRLVWKCNSRNAPSRRAAERLGFRFEGLLRAHMVVKGRLRDTTMMAMLAEEWPAHRAALAAWTDDTNFHADGAPRASLAEIRAAAG